MIISVTLFNFFLSKLSELAETNQPTNYNVAAMKNDGKHRKI